MTTGDRSPRGALDGRPPDLAHDEIYVPRFGGSPFPTDALPSILRDYVSAEAESLQVPQGLIAMLSLVAVATAAQRRFYAVVRDGWSEPCGLYVIVGLPAADRKSAAIRTVCRSLRRWERDATGPPPDNDEATRPPPPRLMVEDITGEALARQLALHGSLGLFSAEAGTFDRMAGRYRSSGDGDADVQLAAHAGDRITVDRVKSGTIRVEHPALSIGLAVQPETLRSLSAVPGAASRGLLARFLYALPKSRVGTRTPNPPTTPPRIRAAFHDRVRDLLDGFSGGPRMPLRFDPDAQADIVDLLQEIEPRLGPDGDLQPLFGWGGKLVGAVARLATLLQLVDDPGSHRVERLATRRAAHLLDYLVEHARLAFHLMAAGDPAEALRDPVVAGIVDLSVHGQTWKAGELLEALRDRDVPRIRLPGGVVAMAHELERLIPTLERLGVTVGPRDRVRARLLGRTR